MQLSLGHGFVSSACEYFLLAQLFSYTTVFLTLREKVVEGVWMGITNSFEIYWKF